MVPDCLVVEGTAMLACACLTVVAGILHQLLVARVVSHPVEIRVLGRPCPQGWLQRERPYKMRDSQGNVAQDRGQASLIVVRGYVSLFMIPYRVETETNSLRS